MDKGVKIIKSFKLVVNRCASYEPKYHSDWIIRTTFMVISSLHQGANKEICKHSPKLQ